MADHMWGPADRWGHMDGWGHMTGWGWIAGVAGILVLALLVVLLVSLIRGTSGRGGPQPLPSSRALDLLDERFARGEIDREEYLSRKSELKK